MTSAAYHQEPSVSRASRSGGDWCANVLEFSAGGLAGCVSKTCVAPLSRLTSLMQVHSMPCARTGLPPSSGLYARDLLRDVYRNDGLYSFWRGNTVCLMHRLVVSSVAFGVNGYFKRKFARSDHGWERSGPSKHLQGVIGPAVGSVCGLTLAHPLDVVKTRLVTSRGRDATQSMGSALRRIACEEGPRGFCRGWSVSVCSTAPAITITFVLFEELRRRFGGDSASQLEILMCGGLAGACASTAVFPLDVVKKQMQLVGQSGQRAVYTGPLDALEKLVSRSGWRALYRGLGLELSKAVPGVAISFAVNEFLLRHAFK
eukprot:TRINITY_DN100694_c0_g1_i1.p1 TRINITY_DN100694_c0_g1~~TRINITY_DN100694_c0_g1_i1.p1  ORF type:complete len:316 (-),score=60.20 TRINITY_DN100694_c0_g1_i1:51-998(-)